MNDNYLQVLSPLEVQEIFLGEDGYASFEQVSLAVHGYSSKINSDGSLTAYREDLSEPIIFENRFDTSEISSFLTGEE